MEFIGTTDTPNNVKNTLEHKTNSSNSIPFVNISQLNSPCIDTPTLFEHTFENAAYYSVDDNHPKAVDIDIDLKNTYESKCLIPILFSMVIFSTNYYSSKFLNKIVHR